jgi:hypothetical protein
LENLLKILTALILQTWQKREYDGAKGWSQCRAKREYMRFKEVEKARSNREGCK